MIIYVFQLSVLIVKPNPGFDQFILGPDRQLIKDIVIDEQKRPASPPSEMPLNSGDIGLHRPVIPAVIDIDQGLDVHQPVVGLEQGISVVQRQFPVVPLPPAQHGLGQQAQRPFEVMAQPDAIAELRLTVPDAVGIEPLTVDRQFEVFGTYLAKALVPVFGHPVIPVDVVKAEMLQPQFTINGLSLSSKEGVMP